MVALEQVKLVLTSAIKITVNRPCTACGFWDTGLNPTQRWQEFEVASAEIGLA
jgi:hypothetical protein